MSQTTAASAARRAKAAARREASLASLEAQAQAIRPVLAGVDTLELHTTAPLRPALVAELEALKVQAQALPRDARGPTWTCAGHVLEVSRGGGLRGPLLLRGEALAVSLNPWAPEGLPTAMIEVRARHLWQSLDVAAQDAEEVLSVATDAETPDAQVSRVDVTADFQGWHPTEADLPRFTCRAARDAAYRLHRQPTGWSWGTGAVLARCYDKTTEIRGTDKAEWMPALWARAPGYDADAPVWRLEFQVRREAVREFTADELPPGALKSWDGTRAHLGSLYAALGTRWLSLRLGRTKDTRQRVDPRWAAIVGGAAFTGCAAPVDLRRVQAETEFRRCLDALGGYLARGVAERWALEGEEAPLEPTLDRLLAEVARHLEKKGTSLDEKARAIYEPIRTQAQAWQAREVARYRARVAAAEALTRH